MLAAPVRVVLGALFAASVAGSAAAQSLVVWDGAGAIVEFSGPPDAAVCGYPAGIPLAFPPAAGCGPGLFPVGPPAPGMPGGVTYDAATDTIYVSDGVLVESYTAAGAFIDSFTIPAPVFGLGFDSAVGLLWSSDGGALAYAVAPPPVGTCGALVPFAVLPFPVPLPVGAGPMSGIDWDPGTGSLLVSTLGGLVVSFLPGGAPGPFGVFPVAPSPCFPPPPALPILRIAVDRGSPFGPGHLYVSDGLTVASVLPGGLPAPPTFAFPGPGGAPCFPSAAPAVGLAFAAHGISYGAGSDPDGLVPPTIGATGASTTPGPLFAHTLTGAVPGGVAILAVAVASACPPIPVSGVVAHIGPPLLLLGPVLAGPAGVAVLPTPLPAGMAAIGATLYTQWIVFKPLGPSPFQASDALSFRIALP